MLHSKQNTELSQNPLARQGARSVPEGGAYFLPQSLFGSAEINKS